MNRASAHEPEARQWQTPRWIVPLFALAAIALLPWAALIVRALPSTHRAAHRDVAWAGFDVALGLLLLAVAVAAWRRSPTSKARPRPQRPYCSSTRGSTS